jgi:hypothetical protein
MISDLFDQRRLILFSSNVSRFRLFTVLGSIHGMGFVIRNALTGASFTPSFPSLSQLPHSEPLSPPKVAVAGPPVGLR